MCKSKFHTHIGHNYLLSLIEYNYPKLFPPWQLNYLKRGMFSVILWELFLSFTGNMWKEKVYAPFACTKSHIFCAIRRSTICTHKQTEFIESLICFAHSQILISHTQTALSFKSNDTTPLEDFGTSPYAHCIHPHVDTARVLSNGHAPAGVSGILWVYHLYHWLCSVIDTHKTVNLGSKKRQEVVV